jgi:hypothetical protein
MKQVAILLIVFYSSLLLGQTQEHADKLRNLEPDVWLGIWDKENSDGSFQIDTLSYDDIPKYLDFRGTVVEALNWKDSEGEKILIQCVTGHFVWKDYLEDSSEYMLQDKSELYAYLFLRSEGEKLFKKQWRVYDYTECFGVDWFAGFIPKATAITDVDNDEIAEISLPYVSICRGGMDPGTMKIIMYEGSTKYALRGSTMLMCKSEHPYGGEYKPSANLKERELLLNFLIEHWNRNKCERGRFY